MRGLGLATLFLGLCLIEDRGMVFWRDFAFARAALFFVALIVILFGA